MVAYIYDSVAAFYSSISIYFVRLILLTSPLPKILLAEDNDFVRMQIKLFLESANYEVIEATDGLTALNLVSDDIELIIVDIRMEPVDGLEFTKSLRAKNNNTPVIFITGDQNPDLLSAASQLGVKATLMKPVEKDRLLKMVARSVQSNT